ncbi:hypothetical protein HHL24_01480 [Paraburkholderia sp. RP-4-7]|uniref:Uncharacterized protein n=1 Tax=Paraburkholderia polaris TaxID=2728848 RepID=A0A848I2Z7_9BURK|nr:hypothetical protein [Paraburkholderia polaris]NML96637.1 hypothetical protein [Paraburkholderia polaris]
MFNFMIIGLGALATALATTLQHENLLPTRVICGLGIAIALIFLCMDLRSRSLYDFAGDILLDLEENSIFADRQDFDPRHRNEPVPFGIYKRAILKAALKLRYLMPTVAILFAGFFLVMLIFAGSLGKGGDDLSGQPQICIAESRCPAEAGGPVPVPSKGTLILSERFPAFEKGSYRMDCGKDEVQAKLARIHDAITRAEQNRMKTVVFLIGSTDRTPLTKKFASQFESNSALAGARVAAVETCLRATLAAGNSSSAATPEIERFVSGPLYIAKADKRSSDAENLMAADRNVSVLVLGFPVNEMTKSPQ